MPNHECYRHPLHYLSRASCQIPVRSSEDFSSKSGEKSKKHINYALLCLSVPLDIVF